MKINEVDMDIDMLSKGGFPHFMLKEIFDQPKCLRDCMRGRLFAKTSTSEKKAGRNNYIDANDIVLSAVKNNKDRLMSAKRFIIVACGTSWHAGLIGKQLIEQYCQIPVEVDYASEFRYRNPIVYPTDVVIAISQSGETADTLAAIELAKSKGSLHLRYRQRRRLQSIARQTDTGIYIHVGLGDRSGLHKGIHRTAHMSYPAGSVSGTLQGHHQPGGI